MAIPLLSMPVLSVCAVSVIFFCQNAMAESPTKAPHTALRVVECDFAFDGGSLAFVVSAERSQQRLVIPHPKSRTAKVQNGGTSPLLLYGSEHKPVAVQQLKSDATKKLILDLSRSPDNRLNNQLVAVLLALRAGMEIKVWGAEAIEALENGKWLMLFQEKKPQTDETDPFSFE